MPDGICQAVRPVVPLRKHCEVFESRPVVVAELVKDRARLWTLPAVAVVVAGMECVIRAGGGRLDHQQGWSWWW